MGRKGHDPRIFSSPGDNTKYLSFNLELQSKGRVDMKDPEALKERIRWYFELCQNNDQRPTMAALAVALGMSRLSLYNYREQRDSYHLKPECREILDNAISIINAFLEDLATNGQIHPTAFIFLGKNYFGMKDEVEITARNGNQTLVEMSAEDLRKKYLAKAEDDAPLAIEQKEDDDGGQDE